MKQALKLISVAAVVAFSSPVFAQASHGFNVTASLSARCVSNTTGTPVMNFGAYTAFGAAATPAPTAVISFRCSRGMAPATVALDAASGSISGVAYTLAIGTVAPTLGDSGAAGTVGTYDSFAYTVTGSMAAGQAGDTAIAAAPQPHLLTITY